MAGISGLIGMGGGGSGGGPTPRADGSIIGPSYVWCRYKIEMDGTSGKGLLGSIYESLLLPAPLVLSQVSIYGEDLESALDLAELEIGIFEPVSGTELQNIIPSNTVITDINGYNGTGFPAPQVRFDDDVQVEIRFENETTDSGTLYLFMLFHLL